MRRCLTEVLDRSVGMNWGFVRVVFFMFRFIIRGVAWHRKWAEQTLIVTEGGRRKNVIVFILI